MIGAIIGDIVGSVYEFNNIKTKDFPLFAEASTFTDDTVCTVPCTCGIALYALIQVKRCGYLIAELHRTLKAIKTWRRLVASENLPQLEDRKLAPKAP